MKASHCVLSVGFSLAVLFVGASLMESDVSAGLAVPRTELACEVGEESATLERAESAARSASDTSPVIETARVSTADVSEPVDAAWALIARLESLAKEPETFHQLALPVIAELGETCEEALPTSEVLERVVKSEDRLDLVRGAALLGIASQLTELDFDEVFFDSFGMNEASPELLRATAIASSLRGEKSYCGLPLDLEFLAQLQSADSRLPNIYPLRIEHIPSAIHLEALRGWIEGAVLDANDVEPAQIGDFFVTAELLFAVWGHAALHNAEIEQAVLVEASKGEAQRAAENALYLRAASFLVHSLAPCNDRMFDLSVQMAESEDSVTAMLSSAMSAHMAGGIGIALMAKVEAVRYAMEPGSSAELSTYLLEVGEGLASISDPAEHALAIDYVDDIVQDPIVDGTARSMGLMVLSKHASWGELLASASGVLQPGAPEELQAIALTSLVERAGSDATRRSQTRSLFEEIANQSRGVERHATLDEYLEILSQ